jgi:hypothetical protein
MNDGNATATRPMTVRPSRLGDGLELVNDHVIVDVLTTAGPRIRDFRAIDGTGVFATVPDATVPVGDEREFRLIGGHRLWIAPEVPSVTYLPDDAPVHVEESDNGLAFTQAPHAEFPVSKTITVALDGPTAHLDHTLVNHGDEMLDVAPWAITMVERGGRGIMPLGHSHDNDLQAERSIVLWPYTGLDDPGLLIERHSVTLHMDRDERIKVGTPLTRGWLAYALGHTLFVKRAAHGVGAHVDHGATAQMFADHTGGELETLGPLVALEPGGSTTHRESWEIHVLPHIGLSTDDLIAIVEP